MKKSSPLTQPATPPPPAKAIQQTDPTSILFRHKAYDLHIDTAHDPVRYWFSDRSGPRYILIRDGDRRVARCPVYTVHQGKVGPLAAYRLTSAGQFIEL